MQSEGASFADQLIPVSMRTMSGIILYIISQVLYHAVIMIYLTDETLKIRPETAVTFALLQEDDASPEVATSNSDTSLWKASILAELSKQFGESSGLNRLMTGILFLLKSIFHGLKLFKETFSKSTVPGSK